MILEKRHRLPPYSYRGYVVTAFTVCLRNRTEFFVTSSQCDVFAQLLLKAANKHRCEVVIYLFMPDHCHIVLEGTCEKADALAALRLFKQLSGYWLAKHASRVSWQKGYYDHILRTESDVRGHVSYILGNPVRKGLIEDWTAYPYKGSSVCDVNTW